MAATEPFRKEHAHLLEHVEQLRELAATLPGASPTERTDGIAEAVGFLRDRLIPHADAEERILYPAVAEILGSPAATATMISDHRAIVERIDALESAAGDDVIPLQELLYGLHALLVVHFRKEEDDYLPLLEERPDAEVAAVLSRMERHTHASGS